MYRAVTRQIEVTVEPNFVPEQSSAERSRFFWSYTIVITNAGEETVQLKTRHWIITDATGRQQEVKGEGVIGEQPVIAPGKVHEYQSFIILKSPSGHMEGEYHFVRTDETSFDAQIPRFELDATAGFGSAFE